jgi:hypothetical protein
MFDSLIGETSEVDVSIQDPTVSFTMLIIACLQSIVLPPNNERPSTLIQLDQHRRKELVFLRLLEGEPSARFLCVLAKLLLRGELDAAQVASSLLHADEVKDVDVGFLHILRASRLARDPEGLGGFKNRVPSYTASTTCRSRHQDPRIAAGMRQGG